MPKQCTVTIYTETHRLESKQLFADLDMALCAIANHYDIDVAKLHTMREGLSIHHSVHACVAEKGDIDVPVSACISEYAQCYELSEVEWQSEERYDIEEEESGFSH